MCIRDRFYSDEKHAKVIVETFWDYWQRSETVDPRYNKIGKNIVGCTRYPHGKFQYQVYLKKDVHKYLSNHEKEFFKSKKIKTKNTHGTGCTLSSAIATYFSCGKTLKKSCKMAIDYVNHSIGSGPNFGKGHGPINHISVFNIKNKFK